MALRKEQKKKIVEELTDKIEKQKSMVFFDFTGLKVKDLSQLRKKMKAEGSEIKVAKKTLLKLALKKAGLGLDTEKLKGEVAETASHLPPRFVSRNAAIAIAFGFKNEISPAKLCYQFSLTNPNLKILAGFFEGKLREAEEIITLAQIPSREELLAKLAGSLSAPISGFVNVLEANIKGLIYALSAVKK